MAKPGAQVILRADFNDICSMQLGLLHKLIFELGVRDIRRKHDSQHGLVLDALSNLLVSLNDAVRLIHFDQLSDGFGRPRHRLLVDLLLSPRP